MKNIKSLFFILVVFFSISSCKKNEKESGFEGNEGPASIVENFEALYSDSAQVKARIRADHQQIFESGDMKLYGNLNAQFFGAADTLVRAVLKADTAAYSKSKNEFKFAGNVEAVNFSEQRKINTDEIYLDSRKNIWRSDSAVRVRVESPGQLLYGRGLEAAEDFSWYKIHKPTGEFDFFKDEESEIN